MNCFREKQPETGNHPVSGFLFCLLRQLPVSDFKGAMKRRQLEDMKSKLGTAV